MSSLTSATGVPKIYNRATPPDVPAWCPICELAIASNLDAKSFIEYGCCHECENDTVNMNFAAWKAGWRPDPTYVKDRLAERNDRSARRYYLKRGS